MQTHDLIQGSDKWLAFRAMHFGASEAAAMLGISKTTTRTELLRLKKLGVGKEFSDWVQKNVLDKGHEVEAQARPIIEGRLGEDLFQLTCSDGEISASCDGATMDVHIVWECKQRNAENFGMVLAGQVPPEHMPQCQQVLMVTKAKKLIFTVSDGTDEGTVSVDVLPDSTWFERLRAGWKQFAADLATYTPAEVVAEVVGRTPESLPALRISVSGAVTDSNLEQYREHALAVFAGINRDLQTDQDFANAAKTVKWCGDVETRLQAAKEHALSQTESIDKLFKTIDDITAEARKTRLELDKLVEARKLSRKGEIVAGGIKALADHVAALNTRIGKPYMPTAAADFGTAVKGLKTFASMQNAVDTALAASKISADSMAARIEANLKHLATEAVDHTALFPDISGIVLKAADDFSALVQFRIADFKAKEEKRKADELAKAAVVVEPVAAPAAAPAPAISRFVGTAPRQAVTEVPDTVSAFLASRRWDKGEDQRARAILVEYEKFRAAQRQPLAA